MFGVEKFICFYFFQRNQLIFSFSNLIDCKKYETESMPTKFDSAEISKIHGMNEYTLSYPEKISNKLCSGKIFL